MLRSLPRMSSSFKPLNPQWMKATTQQLVEQSFTHDLLGMRLRGLRPGTVLITCPTILTKQNDGSNYLTQHHGYLHGGLTTTLADICGGFASMTLMDENTRPLTVELKINMVAPAKAGDDLELIGRGQVIKPGRTLTITEARIYVRPKAGEDTIEKELDGNIDGTLVAIMQQTIIGLKDVSAKM